MTHAPSTPRTIPTPRLHDRDARVETPSILQRGVLRGIMSLMAGDSVRPTEAQVQAFTKLMHTCDPVADEVVAAIHGGGGATLRGQVEQALEEGIETVTDPHPAVAAFIASIDDVPYWVDYDKLDLAAQAIARTPTHTLTALTAGIAFPASYVSPRVNDVLLRGGELADRTAARITETVSSSIDCAAPGGMERFGEGTKNTARVRLVHAYIRAGIEHGGDWNPDTHGKPVNQLHYCVTMVPIIGVALGAMAAGHWYSRRERDAIIHLYRYISHSMGVVPELQVTSIDDLLRLTWLAAWAEVDPDESSTSLTGSTLAAAPLLYGRRVRDSRIPGLDGLLSRVHSDLARLSLGSEYADAVGIPRLSPAVALLPLIAARNLVADRAQVALPGGPVRAARRGHRRRVRAIEDVKRRVEARRHDRTPSPAPA
ncbi:MULTISPECIES: oxygenase MpaB family protein [unclassified Dietzia]|uniref:oxygenase MpaB family protein n=1 Tax=unclassified Dietzia TaxID=2617939 RepID=UPI0015FE0E0C|nr:MULTISPECIES: oxygenase MpaB family protein [unclassified Dietzia]MBB1025700.1 DUF2236 domain-containing protein [Dietzia sp. DQ12-76]MBB1026841.1 DUF2236 domain-containing protein [Dietzia sp. DQ11-38-2]